MVSIKDFKPHEIAYRVCRARSLNNEKVRQETISGVGNKYVYIGNTAFMLKNPSDNYLTEKRNWGSPDLLFLTNQAYDEWQEYNDLKGWIWTLRDKKLTLDQLRAIKEIVEPKGEK